MAQAMAVEYSINEQYAFHGFKDDAGNPAQTGADELKFRLLVPKGMKLLDARSVQPPHVSDMEMWIAILCDMAGPGGNPTIDNLTVEDICVFTPSDSFARVHPRTGAMSYYEEWGVGRLPEEAVHKVICRIDVSFDNATKRVTSIMPFTSEDAYGQGKSCRDNPYSEADNPALWHQLQFLRETIEGVVQSIVQNSVNEFRKPAEEILATYEYCEDSDGSDDTSALGQDADLNLFGA